MKKLFFVIIAFSILFVLGWQQNPSINPVSVRQKSSQPEDLQKKLNTGDTLILIAPDNDMVTIARDEFGVPHITANTETGVFYGQGFAAAQDRLFQMETYRRAAEGKLAEWFGPNYVNADKQILTVFYRHSEVVQQLNDLPVEIHNVVSAYTAGINTYIDSMNSNPSVYKPWEFTSSGYGFEMEPWTVYKSIEVFEFMGRRFGQFGGQELNRLNELQQNGWTWFDEHRPINDPNAPTTIPDGPLSISRNWHYSGITVNSEFIRKLEMRSKQSNLLLQRTGIPKKFGSFAVQITPTKSSSGNVMLLGCPQMNVPPASNNVVNPTNEVELNCPSLHVGGASIAGIPMVIIGHNDNCAWTWTSGYSDNTDVYIDSTFDNSYSSYWYNGQWLPFEEFIDTIYVAGSNPVVFTHYRTIHGPVSGANLSEHQVYSLKMTFWNEESGTFKFVYGQIKAQNITQFESALSLSTLSFNVFYIDRDQNVKFWHSGKYQDRSDGIDPRLPHKGDGSEEWGGFRQFTDLPNATNPTQGYFVNWNNKPVSWWNNGDIGWWPGPFRYDGVQIIKNYVDPMSPFSYVNLENVPAAIDSHGTYQEAIEIPTAGDIIDANLCAPGQSAFIDINGIENPHSHDQWPLYINWQLKDQIFDPVPVELVSFSAICVDGEIKLSWTTATEKNNRGFEIQRSKTGNEFKAIGFVGGYGTTSQTQAYSYTDKNLKNGKYYYRLKQIDFDGSYEYSDVVEVNVNVPIVFSLQQNYPNPFNPATTIKYSIPGKSYVTLKIYDILGSKIRTLINEEKPAGHYEFIWNAADLPSGVYFYQLKGTSVGGQAGDYTSTKKMILLK